MVCHKEHQEAQRFTEDLLEAALCNSVNLGVTLWNKCHATKSTKKHKVSQRILLRLL